MLEDLLHQYEAQKAALEQRLHSLTCSRTRHSEALEQRRLILCEEIEDLEENIADMYRAMHKNRRGYHENTGTSEDVQNPEGNATAD